jgi:hypothetical protein
MRVWQCAYCGVVAGSTSEEAANDVDELPLESDEPNLTNQAELKRDKVGRVVLEDGLGRLARWSPDGWTRDAVGRIFCEDGLVRMRLLDTRFQSEVPAHSKPKPKPKPKIDLNRCRQRNWGNGRVALLYMRPYACCNCSLALQRVSRSVHEEFACATCLQRNFVEDLELSVSSAAAQRSQEDQLQERADAKAKTRRDMYSEIICEVKMNVRRELLVSRLEVRIWFDVT